MLLRLMKIMIVFMVLYGSSAWAVNCQRAATPVENTICNNDNLHWLDSTLTIIYRSMLVKGDSNAVHKQYTDWEKSLNSCTSDTCIERAYYEGISLLSDVAPEFNWEGKWWNMSAPNMSGGTLQLSHSAEWSVNTDIRVWAGRNHDEYTAEARKIYGMALVENIIDTSNCKVLLIPRRSGVLQVYTNAEWGCRLSMPGGGFIDGKYMLSEKDPRQKSTLLTMGILRDEAMDKRFHDLVGDDYEKFVDTANVYIYQDDLDNIGATVVGMWVRGAANIQNAVIMYTKNDIWAARIDSDKEGKPQLHYFSTQGNELRTMPRTFQSWRLRFFDK
ncbi:hypothetical protein [Scandinavium sp.]|uniref:lysozyme inhibitor LprI family protein n=1 Tax=Scandinavium sp. TaxID=2830653 RepID=UPI00289C9CDE|nr:hypothetical protein [Scandinavium sp.]